MTDFTPGPARILVADDNRDAADSLAIFLGLWGYEVCVVHDGWSAYRAGLAFRPQIAIFDVQMPGLHGGEVARRLRQALEPEEPFFIATSATDPLDQRLVEYEGVFDTYLIKPYNLARLKLPLGNSTVHAGA